MEAPEVILNMPVFQQVNPWTAASVAGASVANTAMDAAVQSQAIRAQSGYQNSALAQRAQQFMMEQPLRDAQTAETDAKAKLTLADLAAREYANSTEQRAGEAKNKIAKLSMDYFTSKKYARSPDMAEHILQQALAETMYLSAKEQGEARMELNKLAAGVYDNQLNAMAALMGDANKAVVKLPPGYTADTLQGNRVAENTNFRPPDKSAMVNAIAPALRVMQDMEMNGVDTSGIQAYIDNLSTQSGNTPLFGGQRGSQPVQVNSQEEYDALPDGATFIDGSGQVKIKGQL